MMIADPAPLSGARAEAVYPFIKDILHRQYISSGDLVTAAFQSWRRPNREPSGSGVHGQRFVNHYSNDLAQDYGVFKFGKPFPEGSIIVKDCLRRARLCRGPCFPVADAWGARQLIGQRPH